SRQAAPCIVTNRSLQMSREERQAYWQQQVADWDATDLSAAAFCRQRSLTYHQFVYLRQQLSQASVSSASGVSNITRVTQMEQHGSTELSVTLPGGIRIAGLHAGNIYLLGPILGQL